MDVVLGEVRLRLAFVVLCIPLQAGIDAHLVAAVAWRVPPTKTVA
jgi:hypothetical protein